MTYDVSSTAGTVMGIAGMGIGLGILARTATGVMDTMYGPDNRPITKRKKQSTVKVGRQTGRTSMRYQPRRYTLNVPKYW